MGISGSLSYLRYLLIEFLPLRPVFFVIRFYEGSSICSIRF